MLVRKRKQIYPCYRGVGYENASRGNEQEFGLREWQMLNERVNRLTKRLY